MHFCKFDIVGHHKTTTQSGLRCAQPSVIVALRAFFKNFLLVKSQQLQNACVLFSPRGWQGLIAQGCHSVVLVIDPVTAQMIQALERHKANVVKVFQIHYSFSVLSNLLLVQLCFTVLYTLGFCNRIFYVQNI